jgi:hypothetical protein
MIPVHSSFLKDKGNEMGGNYKQHGNRIKMEAYPTAYIYMMRINKSVRK